MVYTITTFCVQAPKSAICAYEIACEASSTLHDSGSLWATSKTIGPGNYPVRVGWGDCTCP